jgi:SP family myo-inositol transporter-like MFS transporter 13
LRAEDGSESDLASAIFYRATRGYNLFLLLVAGLGGLLYGIDVGIIGGALPYLEATSGLTAAQLSVIVAAVLLGSVISTLFAGLLADWMGRKPLMDPERRIVHRQHSDDCPFARLMGRCFWAGCCKASAADFIGVVVFRSIWPSALGRVQSRQGNRFLPVAAHLGIVAAAGGHVLQLSRSRGGQPPTPQPCSPSRIRPGGASSGSHCRPACSSCWAAFLVSESPRWLFKRGKEAAGPRRAAALPQCRAGRPGNG